MRHQKGYHRNAASYDIDLARAKSEALDNIFSLLK